MGSLSHNDMEFAAEETEVWIVPRFNMAKLALISTDSVGPFKEGACPFFVFSSRATFEVQMAVGGTANVAQPG